MKASRASATNSIDEQWFASLIEASPQLKKLFTKRYCILVIGSVVHNFIDKLLKTELIPAFLRYQDPGQMSLCYLSNSKVEAMEDSLLLAPYLFRLQKSIIVTEPSDSLFEGLSKDDNMAINTVEQRQKKLARAGTYDVDRKGQLGKFTIGKPRNKASTSANLAASLRNTLKRRATLSKLKRSQTNEEIEVTLG